MVSMLASLAFVIGLVLIALRVVQRMRGEGGAGSRVPLAILQRISCGPKQGIALLRVGQRVLVVSLAEQGATLLTELSSEEAQDALVQPAPTTIPASGLRQRFPVLARLPLLALLLAGGMTVHAAPAAAQQDADSASTFIETGQLPTFEINVEDGESTLQISGAVGVVVMMTLMTLLPALFLMMTSFTRILIVLHFLRSALGTQSTPPGQLLVAIAMLLTSVVMGPTIEQANQDALQPFLQGQLSQADAYRAALVPFREFMLANTRESDLATFAEITGMTAVESVEELSTVTVMSSFVTSELKTAFQIGFLLFLPFVVVDLVVASILMSMGMFMLPPVMVSLPFKLLLFVLADGWTLVVRNLVASFNL